MTGCSPLLSLPVLGVLVLSGCSQAAVPLDLTSPNPRLDQTKIAGYYGQEAAFFRLKAEELKERILVYEDLFGGDSDWVKGARLLARFYEESAAAQERLSQAHHELAGPGGLPSSTTPIRP
jgi:hypothetical protein